MNTTSTAARRVGDEIANAGATPQGNQNAFYLQLAANDKVPLNPPSMTYCDVREALFKMAQAITTEAQPIATEDNMGVFPREN